jgi:hypothetical protein
MSDFCNKFFKAAGAGFYAPKYLEGVFSEICIQQCAYNAASKPKGSILNTSTLCGQPLHVMVLDRYTRS